MSSVEKSCAGCGAPLHASRTGDVCATCRLRDLLHPDEPDVAPEDSSLATDLPQFQRFGPYELLEEVGRGGMGVIYRARHAALDRIVALKMLLAGEFADAKARERLLREAKIAARLSHPGIVTIHDVGEHDGRPYFAMEYVPGRNLAQISREGLLPFSTVVRYLEQLALAVHYAHQHGVIHRDLKPANVLLTPDDQTKLTDFGLTKSLVDPTQTLESAGSPNFMAPEQADSSLGTTGTHTDIFGLGAILYFLLTGRPPAVGESLGETLRAVVQDEPLPPRQLRPALPRDLETITLHCLQKDPAHRYPSALHLAQDLARWQRHEPILARPATAGERFLKWTRRHPLVATLSAAIVVSLLAGVIATSWQWQLARAERSEAAQQTYIASLSQAERHLEAGQVSQARTLLLAQPESLRGWEWGRLLARCQHRLLLTPLLENASSKSERYGNPVSLIVSDAGDWLAGWDNGMLEVRSLRTGLAVFQVGSSKEPVRHAAFASDGRSVVTAGPGPGLQFWELPSGRPLKQARTDGAEVQGVIASPDGHLATWDAEGTHRLWNSDQLDHYQVLEAAPAGSAGGDLRFSADGTRVFPRSAMGQRIPLWDVATGRLLALCPPQDQTLRSVTMAPDGQHFATVDGEGRAALWKVGEPQPVFQTLPDRPIQDQRGIEWAIPAPQHHRLATLRFLEPVTFWDTESGRQVGRGSQPVRSWDPQVETDLVTAVDGSLQVWDWASGQVRQTLALDGNLGKLVIRSDRQGRWVAAAAMRADLARNALVWPLRPADRQLSPEFPLMKAALRPNGLQVAAGHINGLVTLWEAESGRRTAVLPGHLRWVLDVAWSGDGQSLFTASADHTVRQWNPTNREPIQTWSGFSQAVFTVSANRDGRLVAASDLSGRLALWEPQTQRVRHSWQLTTNIGAWRVRLSANGRWLAASEAHAEGGVWDTESGQQILRFDPPGTSVGEAAIAVAFSPDDQRLVTASISGQLRFWDTQSWQVTGTSSGAGSPTDLQFSPDGRRLFLSTATDLDAFAGRTAIEVHDGFTGRRLAQLGTHQGWSPGATISADGRRLVRSVLDGQFRPHGVDVWEAFPWRNADYSGLPGATLEDRVDAWAQQRAWERLDQTSVNEPDAPVPLWREPRSNWKPRAPDTPASCLDLTEHYNGHLEIAAFANASWEMENNNLSTLPQGTVILNGVPWDLRGLITTGRREPNPYLSWNAGSKVEGITVGRRGRTLHFLHALWDQGPTGSVPERLGRYRLHYADGLSADLELHPGVDTAPWLAQGPGPKLTSATKAWEGTLPGLERDLGTPRLYHRAYANPRPDQEILSFDLIADTPAAVPFVVAVTVEE